MKKMKKIFSFVICFLAFFLLHAKDVKANSTPVYWYLEGRLITYNNNVTRIVFEDTSLVNHTITTYDEVTDVSISSAPGTVLEYLVGTTLYIQYDGTLYLPANSNNLFFGLTKVTSIEGLQYVNTSNVTSMDSMFSGVEKVTQIDLSHFDTTNVTNMAYMFEGMKALTSLDLSTFTTNNVTDMEGMFKGTSSLTSLNISHFNTSNVTSMAKMFCNMTNLTTLNYGNLNTSNVTNMSYMFSGASSLTSLNLSSFVTTKVTNMSFMFENMTSLTSINVSTFNTSLVTNMDSMFLNLSSISSLDVTGFSTVKVTNMHSMFEGCSGITSINVSNFTTNLVSNFGSMFKGLNQVTTLNLSNFVTTSAIYMDNMFYGMTSLTSIDVSSFNTEQVTNMSGMFYNLTSISTLNLSNFNTAKVTNMSYLFYGLTISSINVSNFNTAKVTNMEGMFANMSNITVLELENFNTSVVTNMESTFYNDSSLEKIYVTDLWTNLRVSTGTYTFQNCTSLSVQYGPSYSPNQVSRTYARINRWQAPGYLSVRWSISSSIYDISYSPMKVDALQNIFDPTNITYNNVTYTYDRNNEILYINYGGQSMYRFQVIKPILSVTLTEPQIVMIKGRTKQLSAEVYPEDTTYPKTFTWTSGDSSILEVDEDGIVTAKEKGTTTVTVRTYNGRTDGTDDSHTDTCTIEVIIPITSFTAESSLDMLPGEETTLHPVTLPADTTEDTTVTWASSDTSVAEIDANGKVTAKSPGHINITGSLNAGRYLTPQDTLIYGHTITIPLWVRIPIDSFEIVDDTYTLYKGDTDYESFSVATHYEPYNYEEDGTITWQSLNPSVATVSSAGIVTAVGRGTARIRGTIPKGYTDTIDVTVKILTLGFSLSNAPDLEIGDTYTFQQTITPENTDYREVTWTSSDTSVATVDQNGTVTAVSFGDATITATLHNGLNRTIVVEKNVHVKKPIIAFNIVESSVDLYIGDTSVDRHTLQKEYTYSDYEVDGTITWTSSDTSVAVVDANGQVRGVGEGTATITGRVAHYTDIVIQDTVTVNVTILALTFDITNVAANTRTDLEIDDTFTFNTRITPNNSSYTHIDWSSSNTSVATVNANGTVTAVAPGTTTITAILRNGLNRDITVTRQVKVLKPITGFNIVESSLDLYVGDTSVDRYTLTKEYTPSDYEVDDTITWTSSDSTIAEVNSSGQVRGKKEGTVTITGRVAHYQDVVIQDTVTVNVTILALTFDITDVATNVTTNLEIGETHTFTTGYTPSDSSYTHIDWSSSATSVATVDQNGTVTAVAPGTTTITAILRNGLNRDITVTREIKVLIPITGFNIVESSVDLYIGDTSLDRHTLGKEYTPSNAEVDRTITWTSSDTSVVTVNSDGRVLAVGEGTATVTGRVAHYTDVVIQDTVTVNVHILALTFEITDVDANTRTDLEIGETHTFATRITPLNASYQTIAWSSSNTNAATVDQNGTVTAVAPGTTTITAYLSNGVPSKDITVTREVKVLKPITGLNIVESSLDLYVGDTSLDRKTLTTEITPEGYEVDDTITWTSSDTTVATVDANGQVRGLTEGTATITGKMAHYTDVEIKDTVTVNVTILTLEYDITDVASGVRTDLEIGDTHTFTTTLSPNNSSYKTVVWSSSNTNAATVDQNGTVTAVAPGTTTITAYLSNGVPSKDITVTREVKVLKPITGFNIVESSVDLYIGNTSLDNHTLETEYTPSDAEVDRTITWTSSDTNVATVDSNGKVQAVGLGTATITGRVAHYTDVVIQDTVTVNVTILALTFNITDVPANTRTDLEIGDTHTFTTRITPTNATYQAITWSSSNTDAVTVDQNGTVTAIAPGTSTISATLQNGAGLDITVTREVKVLKPITGITLTPSTATLYRNDLSRKMITLEPVISPSDAEVDKTITWTTTNSNIASVTTGGVVTAEGVGEATITGTLYNGMHVDCVITVEAMIENFILNNESSVTLEKGDTHRINTTVTPSDATNVPAIVWTSDDPSVASVSNGLVTAVDVGTTTVHAALGDRVIDVDVVVKISITNFTASPTTVQLLPTETQQITTTITPSNASESPTITWTSSNSSVATIDSNKIITAGDPGNAIITGSLENGMTVTISVKVLVPIESFSISPDSVALYKSDPNHNEIQLEYSILPANAEEGKTITWTSSDPTKATVDSNGLVKAVGNGSATITATLPNGMSDTTNVTVSSPISSFTVTNGTNIEMNLTQTHPINTSILPSDTTDSDVITWVSADPTIASVTSAGVITAEDYGTTTITGTLPTEQTVTVTVKVIRPINNVTISQSSLTLYKGDNERDHATLTMNVIPANADGDRTVTWTSSDPTKATVDANGVVTAQAEGNAVITGTLPNGMSDTCNVRVETPIVSFTVVGDTVLNLKKGKTQKIVTEINPSDTSESTTITWTSSDTSKVTVNASGVITTVAVGTSTITGTLQNQMFVQVTVNVVVPMTGFTVGPANFDLLPDDTKELIVTINPSNTTENKTVTWESDDETVATVDANGVVTAIAVGTAHITGTLENGRTSTVTVNVTLTPRTVKRGDFNKDDEVDLNDVVVGLRKIFRYIELTEEDIDIGDLNNDTQVDLSDIVILIRYIFKYIDSI